MKICINYFKETELFLTATLVNMFSRRYNHYLYLQHNTFFRFLSDSSQEYLQRLLLGYRNSLSLSDDSLNFVYYILKNSTSDEFQLVCSEIDSLRENGFHESTNSKAITDEVFYTIQGYVKEFDSKYYSIFDGSELHALAGESIDFSIFSMNPSRFLLKLLLNYEITNFKMIEILLEESSRNLDLVSALETTLITFMLLTTYEAWKKEPKKMSWEDIICKALNADMDLTREVLNKCYISF